MVACRYGRGANSSLVVLNLLRHSEFCTLKIHHDPQQIVWSRLDE
jgi:hypothetical protein